jgi:hypothetical protein
MFFLGKGEASVHLLNENFEDKKVNTLKSGSYFGVNMFYSF